MRAEKVRELLEAGVSCIDAEYVVGSGEHDNLQQEYREALAELEELERLSER